MREGESANNQTCTSSYVEVLRVNKGVSELISCESLETQRKVSK